MIYILQRFYAISITIAEPQGVQPLLLVYDRYRIFVVILNIQPVQINVYLIIINQAKKSANPIDKKYS